MNSALTHSGKVVLAHEYNEAVHGTRLYCIDKSCQAAVIFVPGTEHSVPHFKTTGKSNESKHKESCGFFKKLTFEESIQKVKEYQDEYLEKGIFRETVIRLNFNQLDPDYQSVQQERSTEQKRKKESDIKVRNENTTPKSISSLSSIVKLLTSYEPDILAQIIINFKGRKLPLSQMVLSHDKAHEILWEDKNHELKNYFVFGTVEQVLRREKVWYINFKPVNGILFSLVVFDRYFKHFIYTDEELLNKKVLAWGTLRRNTYNEKNTSEMLIKSDQYISFL